MAWNDSALEGRFSYKKPSLYSLAKTQGEMRLNIDFDYRNDVIKRSVSNHLLRVPIVYWFTVYMNDYFVNLIDTTKKVRIFRVFSVNKDYQYIN
jgi:hypothetical protein